ncbi:MAG TPA: helix-turn-helix transcriptional regulator [bacterium]|nr:helix-turn-helix transcriptional regulator [bacterium]
MDATAHGQTTRNIGIAMHQGSLINLPESMKLWCHEQRVSQSALAMRVGISTSHLNQIIHGHARPSPELAQRIRAVIGSRSRPA